MIKREAGFTLVELLITMVVFLLVIAAASQVFTGLLTQFKQQSKIAETNIEGIIGLEILRRDIEHAGYGLPWNVTGVADSDGDGNLWDELANYDEAASIGCTPNTADFNDASTITPGAPRAILSRNNASFSGCGANSIFNGSDYLVIKAANVARSDASQRWTYLRVDGLKTWTPDRENVNRTDTGDTNNNARVIVISPGSTTANARSLVAGTGGIFFTMYGNVNAAPWQPTDTTDTRLVYGVDPDTNLRMPFNRADYWVHRETTNPATDEVPDRCAPNTGVLRKAVISQNNGWRMAPLPLLDCVADMQVNFWLDTDGDGNINWPPSDDISGLTAQQIRDQLKEIRVYIVAHEGQRDMNYDFSMNNTREALSSLEVLGGNSRTITFVNLKNQIGDPDYKYYRWKVYTLVAKPNNLE